MNRNRVYHYRVRNRARIRRHRGVVAFYSVMALFVVFGASGLAMDLSHLYLTRAKAQRAADAAALAGAIQLLKDDKDKGGADREAMIVAAANGFDAPTNASFESFYPAPETSGYKVSLMREEPLFFMKVFGMGSKTVGAHATASITQPAPIPLTGSNNYRARGPMNLSLYGPYAEKQHGDAYSPLYLDEESAKYIPGAKEGDANPDYKPDGYDFFVQVPTDYSSRNGGTQTVSIELFDPDTYNNGGRDANGTDRVDEIRPPVKSQSNRPETTTTLYSLYYSNGTPDPSDDVLISSASYAGDPATDMKWVQPPNFSFDVTDPRWADKLGDPRAFRINVRSTDGSSENGFLMRAGPPHAEMSDDEWQEKHGANGVEILANGHLPININQDGGVVEINLGTIPEGAKSFYVDKFDTDVRAESVIYTDGTTEFIGKLSANAQHMRDSFTLPDGYRGGQWKAIYTAGRQDTSSWAMFYTGAGTSDGRIRLIR